MHRISLRAYQTATICMELTLCRNLFLSEGVIAGIAALKICPKIIISHCLPLHFGQKDSSNLHCYSLKCFRGKPILYNIDITLLFPAVNMSPMIRTFLHVLILIFHYLCTCIQETQPNQVAHAHAHVCRMLRHDICCRKCKHNTDIFHHNCNGGSSQKMVISCCYD